MFRQVALASAVWVASTAVSAAELSVPMTLVDAKGQGAAIGTVQISETPHGLVFTPDLKSLPPGMHGFHVHQNPSCAPKEKDGAPVAALEAGGHLPGENKDQKHAAPWQDGHLGDLPALFVAPDGTAKQPVLAPRLKSLQAVKNRSLMVHEGGDNYADQPAPLGGGGPRIACGVIKG